jgi:hypothetical protein
VLTDKVEAVATVPAEVVVAEVKMAVLVADFLAATTAAILGKMATV